MSSLFPSLTFFINIEQIVSVPASVYNKSLATQSVTKQELPNYQVRKKSRLKIWSAEEEKNKKFMPKLTHR